MAVMPFIDIAESAHKAGFRGEAAATIIAITVPESGRIPDRIVPEPPSREVPEDNESYGLTCVNKLWVLNGMFTKEELLTADGNMRAAFVISERGTDFTPWMTYLDSEGVPGGGPFRHSLDAAKVAIDARQRLAGRDARIKALQADNAALLQQATAARDLYSAAQNKINAALAALQ